MYDEIKAVYRYTGAGYVLDVPAALFALLRGEYDRVDDTCASRVGDLVAIDGKLYFYNDNGLHAL